MTMNVACQRFCEPDDLFGDRCACALDENDDSDLVDDVIDMASDILVWMSHGRITGICLNTFRPMKVGGGTCGTLVGEYSDYETARFGGMDVIALPGRDVQVLEVEIDGEMLTPSEYGLIDGRYLFRREGAWPTSNSLSKLSGAEGVFEVTVRSGVAPDWITRQAAIELACELATEALENRSRLPRGTVSANVQGVAVALNDALADESDAQGLPRLLRFYAWHCLNGEAPGVVWAQEMNRGWELVQVSGPSGS